MLKLGFGRVIKALEDGLCATREGWNGNELFVCKQVPSTIDNSIIPKMQSLPDSAKKILTERNHDPISYENQMIIIKPNGEINSWVPSSSDIFAKDWIIFDSL